MKKLQSLVIGMGLLGAPTLTNLVSAQEPFKTLNDRPAAVMQAPEMEQVQGRVGYGQVRISSSYGIVLGYGLNRTSLSRIDFKAADASINALFAALNRARR